MSRNGSGPAGRDPAGPGSAALSPLPGRLTSLDAFRGLTIAGMILVNNPGSWSYVYPPLRHAVWHGCTPTDLIFPFFLFIVGVSISLSFSRHRTAGLGRRELGRKALRRAAVIFALGLALNAFPRFDLATLRLFGVLQRIALAYLGGALVTLYTTDRGRWYWAGGLLLLYWGLMTLVPVPGFGAGDLSPEGNLAAWIDRALFPGHLWREAYDPEGLLSTLPAVATVLLGVLTGGLIGSGHSRSEVCNRLFVWGWAGLVAGAVWGIFFPINKPLWTGSYVLFTAGAALQVLATAIWLLDVRGRRRLLEPFIRLGMNPLAIFAGSILLVKSLILIRIGTGEGGMTLYAWIYRHLFASWAGAMNGSLAFALANVLLWLGVAVLLWRRRIFIKV